MKCCETTITSFPTATICTNNDLRYHSYIFQQWNNAYKQWSHFPFLQQCVPAMTPCHESCEVRTKKKRQRRAKSCFSLTLECDGNLKTKDDETHTNKNLNNTNKREELRDQEQKCRPVFVSELCYAQCLVHDCTKDECICHLSFVSVVRDPRKLRDVVQYRKKWYWSMAGPFKNVALTQ